MDITGRTGRSDAESRLAKWGHISVPFQVIIPVKRR